MLCTKENVIVQTYMRTYIGETARNLEVRVNEHSTEPARHIRKHPTTCSRGKFKPLPVYVFTQYSHTFGEQNLA